MDRTKGVVNIKGKEYETVAYRKFLFFSVCPEGTIETDLLENDDDRTVFKAIIKTGEKVKSVGHAQRLKSSSPVCKHSWFEVAETAAIGRALSNGNFTKSSTCSYEEMLATGELVPDKNPVRSHVVKTKEQIVLDQIKSETMDENTFKQSPIIDDIKGLCTIICKGMDRKQKVDFMIANLKVTGFNQLQDFTYRELVEVQSLLLQIQGEH